MTRNEIINSLNCISETDEIALNERMQSCNVRIVRTDGATELTSEIRGRNGAQAAMVRDNNIARIEYRYNGEWLLAC